jgi:hypothetical protein
VGYPCDIARADSGLTRPQETTERKPLSPTTYRLDPEFVHAVLPLYVASRVCHVGPLATSVYGSDRAPEIQRLIERDFMFIGASAESEADLDLVWGVVLWLYFGHPELHYAELRNRPRRLIERFNYAAGRRIQRWGVGKDLCVKIDDLYSKIAPAVRRAGRAAFERDLAFLAQAVRNEDELNYSFQVMAMRHFGVATDGRDPGDLDRDLLERLDFVFDRLRESAPVDHH